jgi:hypothetical protein
MRKAKKKKKKEYFVTTFPFFWVKILTKVENVFLKKLSPDLNYDV